MNRALLLLAICTAAIIIGAFLTKNSTLDFLATLAGIVFLVKCSQAINAEREERAEEAEAQREAHRIMQRNAGRFDED